MENDMNNAKMIPLVLSILLVTCVCALGADKTEDDQVTTADACALVVTLGSLPIPERKRKEFDKLIKDCSTDELECRSSREYMEKWNSPNVGALTCE
jgi:hypothetical protein